MKKKLLSKSLLLTLTLCAFIYPQHILKNRIAPGVIHSEITDTKDTLVINILEVNLDSCNCTLNTAKAQHKIEALEKTSSMASGDNVLAAINADFFEADGSTINNMISGGQIIKGLSVPPYDRGGVTYSQFAFDNNNKPYIERFNFKGLLSAENFEYDIYGINAPLKNNELILYNSLYSLEDLPQEKLVLLKCIPEVNNYTAQSYNKEPLSSEDYVLYNGKGISVTGMTNISMHFVPEIKNLSMLSGGWPIIIKNGMNALPESEVLERVFSRFSNTRHPRTGIGFSQDSTRIFFFVVDGRQASSKGMSLNEFADLMLSHDVYHALNLDGGGSSTMVINGKVMNHPSDNTGERKVGSAILILKK